MAEQRRSYSTERHGGQKGKHGGQKIIILVIIVVLAIIGIKLELDDMQDRPE